MNPNATTQSSSTTTDLFATHEYRITHLLCKVLRFMFLAIPAVWLSTLIGLYDIELSFFAIAMPVGFFLAFFPTLLQRLKVSEKIIKYVAVIAAALVVGMLASNIGMQINISFVVVMLICVLYFDKNFQIKASVLGLIVMAVSVWIRGAGAELGEYTLGEWYIGQMIGYTLEYILCAFVFVVVASTAKGLLNNTSEIMENNSALSSRLLGDVSQLTQEVNTNGDLDYRIDDAKYDGEYRKVVTALNDFTGSFVNDIESVLSALENVNKGDFNFDMKKLPGKKIILNNTLDELMTNLKNVSAEVTGMIDASANKGDLSYKINAHKYYGGWHEIMIGLNNIAEAVNAPLTEIHDVVQSLSKGGFDKKVTGTYSGDFLLISNAINSTVDEISGYLSEMRNVLSGIAAGDLTKTIDHTLAAKFTERSFVEITNAINNITASLHKTMSEISTAARYVLEGANKITTSATELADGSSSQAVSLEELNTAVETVNMQTKEFANNAKLAGALSEKSTMGAKDGNESMNQMVESMQEIKESSKNISQIIKVIQDIAFQTNLLALNAAVEAARAGEHGKGFAVVAEEVRNLASRSQSAAVETTTLINNSIGRVESGSGVAQDTSKSLDIILSGTNEVLDIINKISKDATSQAEMVSEISSILLQTAQKVQDNSKFAHESAATAEELNSQAEMLQGLVDFFKL